LHLNIKVLWIPNVTNNHRDIDVTVYITNYNYEQYIKQSIESVLAQSYSNFELIIIDDGSTDSSKSIIKDYIGSSQVRVIFQDNKGLIASNNIALHAANGKYIIRLDADDYLEQNALLVMVKAIDKSDDLALVYPDYYYVDVNGKIIGQERRHNFSSDVSLLDQPAHGACTLIRRAALLEVGGYSSEFSCQDGWDLWLKLTENYTIQNINLPLFYYRRHDENLTNDTERLLTTRSEIYQKHADRTKQPALKVIAIIPVRGKSIEKESQVLDSLGGRALINWTVDAALSSRLVSEVIVTTPDQEIIDYLQSEYARKVTVVRRDTEEALENRSYMPAIKKALEYSEETSCDAILELTTESPFRSKVYIDKAINVMRVHNIDRVLSVKPDDSMFYRHTGAGLEAVGNDYNNNSLRLERDYIYRQCGGLMLVKSDYYNNKAHNPNEVKGHIILSEKASIRVRNKLEMKVAELYLEDVV